MRTVTPTASTRRDSIVIPWTRRNVAPTCWRRTGISTKRYDASVIATVMAIAVANCAARQVVARHATHDLVHRPVEEVQPVRAGADPRQHGRAEHGAGQRAAVRHRGDHQHGGERDDEEPAAEQPRIGPVGGHQVQLPREQDEDDSSGAADNVEPRPLAAQRAAHHRCRAPQHRERRPDQQTRRPRDRRQVERVDLGERMPADHPVRRRGGEVATRVVRHAHGDRDDERGHQQPAADLGQPAAPESQQAGHHERPHEVELLLHRQAPQVAQRRPLTGGGVSLADPDLIPVRHVAGPGEHVTAQLTELVAFEQRGEHGEQPHHHEQRRQEAAGPAQPERLEVDASGPLVLPDQQQRDQVAADDEEHLDADEPARQPVAVGVVHHHRDDRQRPHAVEPRQVGDPRDRRSRSGRDLPQRRLAGHGHVARSYGTAVDAIAAVRERLSAGGGQVRRGRR